MDLSVRNKLSIMMFLEFAIWGTWLPTAVKFMKTIPFTTGEITWIMNAFVLGSITAIFFSNQFADRNFSAEKFLAFSQFVGGVAMIALYWADTFWPFFGLMLVHAIFYVPTISITNSIAFANLTDPQKEFGLVRMWGSIGWIVMSVPFIFLPAGGLIFVAAGICSLVLAGFSLVLPHTPPKPAQAGGEKAAWLEALRLLRQPFLLALFIVTFVDSAIHQSYFILAASYLETIGIWENWIMVVMGIGQITELVMMAVLGFCLKRLGWRNVMVLGILAYTLRYFLFALAPSPLVAIPTIALHGVGFAFFFAALFIFVDEFFPKDARSSAQGLFNLLFVGVGPMVGIFLAEKLEDLFGTLKVIDGKEKLVVDLVGYRNIFLILGGIALAAAIGLYIYFRPPQKAAEPPATA